MLVRQTPIESQLMAHIRDNLNAEIALGLFLPMLAVLKEKEIPVENAL